MDRGLNAEPFEKSPEITSFVVRIYNCYGKFENNKTFVEMLRNSIVVVGQSVNTICRAILHFRPNN